MNPDKRTERKDERYSDRYLDFFEFCIEENEEFYNWKRSQDISKRNDEAWLNTDFLSINGRRL